MADAAVEKKDAVPEEVSSTEVTKESPVKKSPAKKAAEVPESNGKEENGSGDAADDTPAENGQDSNDAVENGDESDEEEKVEIGVKRKSASKDNGNATEKLTPEKKAKVVEEEAPAEAEEAAA